MKKVLTPILIGFLLTQLLFVLAPTAKASDPSSPSHTSDPTDDLYYYLNGLPAPTWGAIDIVYSEISQIDSTHIRLLTETAEPIPLTNQWQSFYWILDTGYSTSGWESLGGNLLDSNDLTVAYFVTVSWAWDGSLNVRYSIFWDGTGTQVLIEDARDNPTKYFDGNKVFLTLPLSAIGYPSLIEWVAGSSDGVGGSSGKHDKAPNAGHITLATSNVAEWVQGNENGFGNPVVTYVCALKAFNGHLYAGTSTNVPSGGGWGEVWRTADGLTWERTVANSFDEPNEGIASMATFNGYLYVGTYNTVSGCQIWRSPTGDAGTWQKVASNGFSGDKNVLSVYILIVFNGYLYAGTGGSVDHAMTLWRTDNGLIWEPVTTDGFGDSSNIRLTSACIFGDYLYVGTSNEVQGGEVWRSMTGDPGSWELASHGGFGDGQNKWFYEATVFQNRMYMTVARGPSSAGTIWRTMDGLSWEKVTVDGFGDSGNNEIRHLIVFENDLWAGTRGNCEMWRSPDGVTWLKSSNKGFDDPNNWYIMATEVFRNSLFAGTWNMHDGCEVWATPPPEVSTVTLSSSIVDVQNTEYLTDFGTIVFDDTTYPLPTSFSKDAGFYSATANPPEHYVFDIWEYSGDVFVSDGKSQTAIVAVSGDGELKAQFKPEDPHLGLISTYFPQYRFSLGETWFPCSFDFDDNNIANNPPTSEDSIGNYRRYFIETNSYPPYYVYVHEVEDTDYLTIQYWLYYVYNHPWIGDIPVVSHSHDWETVWVIFSKEDLGEPYGVVFFAHGVPTFFRWVSVNKAEGTNHPIVCVALGTHASYHPLQMAEFWLKRFPTDNWFPGGQVLDQDSFSWVLVFGDYLRSSSDADISLIGYDTVVGFGTGIAHPIYRAGYWPNRFPPNISPLTPEPIRKIWQTADPAPWRRVSGDPLWKDSKGQAKEGLWDVTLPEFPKYIKMAVACPVDIHVYDQNGRHVGRNYETGEIEIQIPNTTFEEMPNGQYVLIERPAQGYYDVELIGTSDGNYSFVLALSFNGTSSIVLDYGMISEGETHQYCASISATGETRTIAWEHVFRDTKRGTILKISTDDKYFQFIAPDKEFSIKEACKMVVYKYSIVIWHKDSEIELGTIAIDTKIDFCFAIARDMQTRKSYLLVDPVGKE